MQKTSPIPRRVILSLVALVAGGWGLGVGPAMGWYDRPWMLLAMICWYTAVAADVVLVALGAPRDGWPRIVSWVLAGICLLCVGGGFLRQETSWPLLAMMVICAVPVGGHALTGKYLFALRDPGDAAGNK